MQHVNAIELLRACLSEEHVPIPDTRLSPESFRPVGPDSQMWEIVALKPLDDIDWCRGLMAGITAPARGRLGWQADGLDSNARPVTYSLLIEPGFNPRGIHVRCEVDGVLQPSFVETWSNVHQNPAQPVQKWYEWILDQDSAGHYLLRHPEDLEDIAPATVTQTTPPRYPWAGGRPSSDLAGHGRAAAEAMA